MSETNTVTGNPVVTQEIVTAKFQQEVISLKYSEALNFLNTIVVTEENLEKSQEAVKRARAIVKGLDGIKTKGKAPALAECRYWDNSFGSLSKPLESAINSASWKIQAVANEVADRARKAEQEKARKEAIKRAIDAFIFEQTHKITETQTIDQIVAIEKLIGSHKAAESRYQEFLEEFKTRVEELTPLLKAQKANIKAAEEAAAALLEAQVAGDDEKVIELTEKQEEIADRIEETKVVIQETAISSAINASPVTEDAVQIFSKPKPRRTTYSYRVVDEKKAYAAGMLICELDKEKAKLVISGVKEEITPDQSKIINGVEYFIELTY